MLFLTTSLLEFAPDWGPWPPSFPQLVTIEFKQVSAMTITDSFAIERIGSVLLNTLAAGTERFLRDIEDSDRVLATYQVTASDHRQNTST